MIKKEIVIGLFLGLAANLLGVYLYTVLFSELGFTASLKEARQEEVLGRLIAAGAVLNFLPFFYFLQKNRVYRARGVLLASILAALLIGVLQLSDPDSDQEVAPKFEWGESN